jgi:uncharacterized protein
MTHQRRRSLAVTILAITVCAGTGRALMAGKGAGATSKQAALDSIARNVLLPAYSDLAARCREFATAADALTASPSEQTLGRAQQRWREALLSWRRAQSFAHGPIADLGVYNRIQFWPSRRQSVDRVLRAQRPIDDGYIQELGANAVGLSALEMMLFDTRQDDAARLKAFSGTEGARQRDYFRALARELVQKTTSVEAAWKRPGGYAAVFGAGGQDQLNVLVNDILAAIETGAQDRLRLAREVRADSQFRAELVEGGLSNTSHPGLLALLTGAQSMFSGAGAIGLDDYLRHLRPATARRVELQFQKAVDSVRAIDAPLEQAAATKAAALQQAQDDCRALEILLKTEVASTLGVTLTFKSKDGD